jgi:hypothetical protein
VPDAAVASPQIGKFLAERAVSVSRIERIRPSLEDVFVSLTTASSAAEARKS